MMIWVKILTQLSGYPCRHKPWWLDFVFQEGLKATDFPDCDKLPRGNLPLLDRVMVLISFGITIEGLNNG
jgi:hypothetical protein